jgi:prevent-host-death family protein
MLKVNIHEARVHFSRYLRQVERGETILICKRNDPIAELRPFFAPRNRPRPIGLAKGTFTVPLSFFEDLPDDQTTPAA